MRAFTTGIARSVRSSLGRFLAIAGIVALGCGFFAGLRMCGPDMRAAADAYYDGTLLWDLRVVSTQGLGEKDLERLAQVGGVRAVAGSTSVDVMARVGSEQVAVRVATLPGEYAHGGEPDVNRLELRGGRWPSAPGECVVSADNPALPASPGDVVGVLSEAGGSGLLAVDELTVVGTVSSSAYPYTVSFGSTTLGSGTIDQYAFVAPGTFSEEAPYTEAYLTVSGASPYESGGEKYERVVGDVRSALEGEAGALAEARAEDLRSDAQAQVDDARAELEASRAAAESELSDTRSALDAAAAEIADGRARLAEGRTAYADAAAQLEARRADAQAQLSAAADQLDAAQAELDAQVASLDQQEAAAEQARSAYEAGVPELLAALGEQGLAVSDLDGARSALSSALDEASSARARLTDLMAPLEQLEAAGTITEQQRAQLEAVRTQAAQLDEGIAALTATSQQADQLASARDAVSSYDAARSRAAQAQADIDAGRSELEARRFEAESQLSEAQAALDASAAELASGEARLEESQGALEEGEAAWRAAGAEAQKRLDEAAAQVDEAQAQVDAIEPGELYVLDRTQSEGAATYQADSERMDTIATVFPFMFFLVAALVALTTMTRMVEDERGQIGTYKALGYGTARIASRYLAYAASAATAGAALGILVLTQVLPLVIMSAYGIIYAVPPPSLPLPVDPAVALSSGGLGVGVTLVATWAAVVSAVRETPASLMQPRAPKAGRRILLERVGPLWRRLSFLRKVAARNLFRYKRRLFMTVVGISGCTALLLVGFGLHDAIWDIIDNQFGGVLHYNATVTLEEGSEAGDVSEVASELGAVGATDLAHVELLNLQAGSASSDGTLAVQVVVPEDASDLARAVTLRERVTQEAVPLPADGVLLAEKTASRLGVSAGDTVTLYAQDAIGSASGDGVELSVSGVVENYVGNVAYLGRGCLDELSRAGVSGAAEPSFSTVYASVGADAAAREALSERLEATGLVSTVTFTDETVDMYRSMLSAVDLIVAVLIVSAAALAFIVLYNLTNINVSERVREIATLKVLGFRRGEVYAYIFREILILALIGDVAGLALGTWLEGFVVVTAEVDLVMFGRQIHPASYAYAFALTLVFAGLVMLAMRRKLDRVSMVESLKSVD